MHSSTKMRYWLKKCWYVFKQNNLKISWLMILKDWARDFVLGEFPSISRCSNMRKHPPPCPKRPPAGGQQKHTFPESSPHRPPPKWRASIESLPKMHIPTTPNKQFPSHGNRHPHPLWHPKPSEAPQLYSLKITFKQKQRKNNYNSYQQQQ